MMAICSSCARGADHCAKFGNRKVALAYHAECKGCDCQHKVDIQLADKAVAR